jgi:hypothetical protein
MILIRRKKKGQMCYSDSPSVIFFLSFSFPFQLHGKKRNGKHVISLFVPCCLFLSVVLWSKYEPATYTHEGQEMWSPFQYAQRGQLLMGNAISQNSSSPMKDEPGHHHPDFLNVGSPPHSNFSDKKAKAKEKNNDARKRISSSLSSSDPSLDHFFEPVGSYRVWPMRESFPTGEIGNKGTIHHHWDYGGQHKYTGSEANAKADNDCIFKQAVRLTGKIGYQSNYTYGGDGPIPMRYGEWGWSAWFKINKPLQGAVYLIGVGLEGHFFGWSGASGIFLHPTDNKITVEHGDVSFSVDFTQFPLGSWNHIMSYTHDHGDRILYINGRKVGAKKIGGSHGWWERGSTTKLKALVSTSSGNDISIDLPALLKGGMDNPDKAAHQLYWQQRLAATNASQFGPTPLGAAAFVPPTKQLKNPANTLMYTTCERVQEKIESSLSSPTDLSHEGLDKYFEPVVGKFKAHPPDPFLLQSPGISNVLLRSQNNETRGAHVVASETDTAVYKKATHGQPSSSPKSSNSQWLVSYSTAPKPVKSLLFKMSPRIVSVWVMWAKPPVGNHHTLVRIYNEDTPNKGDFCICVQPSKNSVLVQSDADPISLGDGFFSVLPLNQYHHFAAVYQKNNITLYLNGQLIGQTKVSTADWWNSSNGVSLNMEVAKIPLQNTDGIPSGHHNDVYVDMPMVWASSLSSFESSNVDDVYQRQVKASTAPTDTSKKGSLSGYTPFVGSIIPFSNHTYEHGSKDVTITPVSSTIYTADLTAHKSQGLVMNNNKNANAASGAIKWKLPYPKNWISRKCSQFSIWFKRCEIPSGSGANHALFSINGSMITTKFSKALRTIVAGTVSHANHPGAHLDAFSSFPLHVWNCLYVFRDTSEGCLCLFVNGQYIGKVGDASLPNFETDDVADDNDNKPAVETIQTNGTQSIVQNFSMTSAPSCSSSSSSPLSLSKKSASKTWLSVWNQDDSDNQKHMNVLPLMKQPVLPDTVSTNSSPNNSFHFVQYTRLIAVFPDVSSSNALQKQIQNVKDVVNTQSLYGPMGAAYEYSVGDPGDVTSKAGTYAKAFYTGDSGDGTCTLSPTNQPKAYSHHNDTDLALLSGKTWCISGWFCIPKYPSVSTKGTLCLLEAHPPSGSDADDSNGLSVEFDYALNKIQVLKQADNEAFAYLRHSFPENTWFFFSISLDDTGDHPVITLRLNGKALQNKVTSKKTALPSWWSEHAPTFILGNQSKNDIPFCADRIVVWSKDLTKAKWLTDSNSVISQTKPSQDWTAWKADTGPPHELLPSSVKHTWAASLLSQDPSGNQKVTGESDIRELRVSKVSNAEIRQEENEVAVTSNGGVTRDNPGMYNGALRMRTGHQLSAVSSTVHNWVQNNAFVFSMWIKPNKVLSNPVEFFGLRKQGQDENETTSNPAAPQCRINPANQKVDILGEDTSVTVDTFFSLPKAQWTHIVLHRVGQKKFRVYINQLRIGEIEAKNLPNWWDNPSQNVAVALGRPGNKMDVSIDLPFWFRGDSTTSQAADTYGSTDLVEGYSDNWGDKLIAKLYTRQLSAAVSRGNPHVSQTRPLSKVVLGNDAKSQKARQVIGLLTVFPSYSGPNAPSHAEMQTGGAYGPYAGTYGYKGVGESANVSPGQGVFQSAFHVPGSDAQSQHLAILPGEIHGNGASDASIKEPTLDSEKMFKAVSLWFKVPQWVNNTTNILEIVSASETGDYDDSDGDNNLVLRVDKTSNVIQLFPHDKGKTPEKAGVQVYDTFRNDWNHIHIVRTQGDESGNSPTKAFEVYINGHFLHKFEPSQLPSWWGHHKPKIRCGRGYIKTLFDFIIWHQTIPTTDQLHTIMTKSAPSGWVPNPVIRLTPGDVLPSFLDPKHQYGGYLLDATQHPQTQVASGTHALPPLEAVHVDNNKEEEEEEEEVTAESTHHHLTPVTQDVVYKGAVQFCGGATTCPYLNAKKVPLHSLVGNSMFVIQLWCKPVGDGKVWNGTTDNNNNNKVLEILNLTDGSSSVCFRLDAQNNRFIFGKGSNGKVFSIPLFVMHSVPAGKWSSLMLSRDSTTQFSLYVNGSFVGKTKVDKNDLPSIFSTTSKKSLELSVGALGNKSQNVDDDTVLQLDLLLFYRPPQANSWSQEQLQKLYATPRHNAQSSTSFATVTALPYPLLPGKAHSLWTKNVPQLMYVILRGKGASCFGQSCEYHLSPSMPSSGIEETFSRGVYEGSLLINGKSSGAEVDRGRKPPSGFPSMKKWMGQSAFTVTAWVYAQSSWPQYPVVLFEVRSGDHPNESGKLQYVVNAANNTLSVSDIDGATASNQNINQILSPGNWHHIALSRSNGTTFTMYIDGQKIHTFHFSSDESLPMWWGHDRVQIRFGRTLSVQQERANAIQGKTPASSFPSYYFGYQSSDSKMIYLDYMTFWQKCLSDDDLNTLMNETSPSSTRNTVTGKIQQDQRYTTDDGGYDTSSFPVARAGKRGFATMKAVRESVIPAPGNARKHYVKDTTSCQTTTKNDSKKKTAFLAILLLVTICAVIALLVSASSGKRGEGRSTVPSFSAFSSSKRNINGISHSMHRYPLDG